VCLLLLALMPAPQQLHEQPPASSGVRENEEDPLLLKMTSSDLLVDGLRSALSNRNIILTLPVFLVGIFRYTTLNVLIQYASVRFGLKISTGATFYTETAIVNISLFLFLIPQLTAVICKEYNILPQVIDLFLVRMSVSLMCLGALSIGLAQSDLFLPIGEPLSHLTY
jgi:hypothetical protein